MRKIRFDVIVIDVTKFVTAVSMLKFCCVSFLLQTQAEQRLSRDAFIPQDKLLQVKPHSNQHFDIIQRSACYHSLSTK